MVLETAPGITLLVSSGGYTIESEPIKIKVGHYVKTLEQSYRCYRPNTILR